MSRFTVLVGLLCVSVVVLVVNWPLVQPEIAPFLASMHELLASLWREALLLYSRP